MKQPEKNLVLITPSVSPRPQIEATESIQNDIQKAKEIILENNEVALNHCRFPPFFEKPKLLPVHPRVNNLRNRKVSSRDVNGVILRENTIEVQVDHPPSEVAQKTVSVEPTINRILLEALKQMNSTPKQRMELFKRAAHKPSSNSSPSKVKKSKTSTPSALKKSQNKLRTNAVTRGVNGAIGIKSTTVEVPKKVVWAPINSSSSNFDKEINTPRTAAKQSQNEEQETYAKTSGDAIGGTRLKDLLD